MKHKPQKKKMGKIIIEKQFKRTNAEEKIRSHGDKIINEWKKEKEKAITNNLKSLSKKKISYKSGNPLKGLLKHKQNKIKVHGGEQINLFKAEW